MNSNDFEHIQYVICVPSIEGYYQYSINCGENFRLIDKNQLQDLLLIKLGCLNKDKYIYLTERNLPFIYSRQTNKVQLLVSKENNPTFDFRLSNNSSLYNKCKTMFGRE